MNNENFAHEKNNWVDAEGNYLILEPSLTVCCRDKVEVINPQ